MLAKNEFSKMTADELKGQMAKTGDEALTERQLGQVAAAAEKKEIKTQTHAEIMAAYEGADSQTKVKIDIDLLNNALAETGIHTLDQAVAIAENDADFLSRSPRSNKTQVFFKQISEDRKTGPLWKRKSEKVKTEEVLVVIRLNNSKDPEKNTVVYGVVKHVNGTPQIGGQSDLYRVMSEKDYSELITSGSEEDGVRGCDAKVAFGEFTQEGYRKAFVSEKKETLDDHWKRWDSQRSNEPAWWKSERVKGEVLNKLEGRYGEILQEAQQRLETIRYETESKRKAAKEKREAVLVDGVFQHYFALVEEERIDDVQAKLFGEKFGMSGEELNALVEEARKRRKKRQGVN